jgi:hypothetical protein
MLWLCFQAASLSALVPSACCAAHREASAESTECHGDASGACPMHAATGEECPMHAASGTPVSECVMRGLCNAPAGALSLLIPLPGILAVSPQTQPLAPVARVASVSPQPLESAASYDTPPPRT